MGNSNSYASPWRQDTVSNGYTRYRYEKRATATIELLHEKVNKELILSECTGESLDDAQLLLKNTELPFKRVETLLIRCKLSRFPMALSTFSSISVLNISSCSQAEVDIFPTLLPFPHLTTMILDSSKVSVIPQFIGNSTKLASLSLKSTKISTIPDFFTNLKKLETLFLNNSEISSLKNIDLLPALKCLELSDCAGISKLTKFSFGKKMPIRKLDMSHCSLTEIPSFVADCSDLETLTLTNNLIKEIPQIFLGLKSLGIVDMENNTLAKLDSLMNFHSLNLLNLSGNSITTLPGNIGEFPIQVLKLLNNDIITCEHHEGPLRKEKMTKLEISVEVILLVDCLYDKSDLDLHIQFKTSNDPLFVRNSHSSVKLYVRAVKQVICKPPKVLIPYFSVVKISNKKYFQTKVSDFNFGAKYSVISPVFAKKGEITGTELYRRTIAYGTNNNRESLFKEEVVQKIWSVLGWNSTSVITKEEFLTLFMFLQCYQFNKVVAFMMLDWDGDGVLSTKDFDYWCVTINKEEKWCTAFDDFPEAGYSLTDFLASTNHRVLHSAADFLYGGLYLLFDGGLATAFVDTKGNYEDSYD